MVRARNRPDGITAPTCSGFSIHERRKRTSSSRRRGFFDARTDDCNGMSLPDGTAFPQQCQKTVTKTYRERTGRSSTTPASGTGAGSKEVLDLGEEAGGLRLRCTRGEFVEFGEQFLLSLGQVLRSLDHDLHIHVAGLARAQ